MKTLNFNQLLHEHKLIACLIMKEKNKITKHEKMPELENWIVSQRQDVIRNFIISSGFTGTELITDECVVQIQLFYMSLGKYYIPKWKTTCIREEMLV